LAKCKKEFVLCWGALNSTITRHSNITTTDEFTTDELTTDEFKTDEMRTDEMTADEMTTDEMTDQMTRIPVD
jgi:pentapeptide MXKDX repeat protein